MGKQLKQYGILRPCVTIKKLLTNNYSICNLPFYNSKYIKCFQTFEDIDLEWVRRKENIDYGYRNEFSSVKILDMINKHFK